MIELEKLIRSMQDEGKDIVIANRHIILERTMNLSGKIVFENCEIEIKPYKSLLQQGLPSIFVAVGPFVRDITQTDNSRFFLEKDAAVTFENCSFFSDFFGMPMIFGYGEQKPVISAAEGSTLAFRNCRFENVNSFILSKGAVDLHDCEIMFNGKIPSGIEESTFLFFKVDGKKVELTDCSFDCAKSDRFSVKLTFAHDKLTGFAEVKDA